jgi:hypothetical protein
MKNLEVEVGNARETSTGVERGTDVDFTLTLDGVEIEGEVTLLPHEDGSPGYGAWGQVDNWLDGRTVATVRKLSRDDYTDVCSAIIEATAPVARAFARGAR